MSWRGADDIDRTAKILLDSGQVNDFDDADLYLEALVLQIAAGPEIADDPAAQAALVTAVNAGCRAYRGGVHVRLDADVTLTTGWAARTTASQCVIQNGGTVVNELIAAFPTLVIGRPQRNSDGRPLLFLGWNGWSGGVSQAPTNELSDCRGTPIAGILAAALGVSETFQRQLGATTPGRRDVGISLWRPDMDWRMAAAAGPPLQYLPAGLWLLGLGHLGQAYAWTLGMLPYADPSGVRIGLVDFDTTVKGNAATQLLVTENDIGQRKTRIVAAQLENLGFTTQLVERAFDRNFHPVSHGNPMRNEPTVALAGFDDIAPRRELGDAGFKHIVDGGIGNGPVEYLDLVLHTFPKATTPVETFREAPPRTGKLSSAYDAEVTRRISGGLEESAARCGILEVAGITVGAAFVGTVASTLAIADILRLLHGGDHYAVIGLDLRTPQGIHAVHNAAPGTFTPPSWTPAL